MIGEGASGLGDGPQVDGVGGHLTHGHLGLHDLVAVVVGVHAHDAATALVEVADDIAHIAVGNGDLQLTDGLQQHGVGLGQSGLVGQLGGRLKGHFRGVHGVIGTIVQGGLQVHYRVTGQHTVLHSLPQALLHGGEVVLGHSAAHDFLAELHLFLVAGLEADPYIAELAVAAGLLLVAALDLHLLADLLTVGNTRSRELGVHAEAALQTGHQHI